MSSHRQNTSKVPKLIKKHFYKMVQIKNLPKICRPREKLIAKGPQNLKDEELLAKMIL